MKHRKRWILVGLVLGLSALLVHGCGGDDDNPAGPGPGGGGTGTPDVTITITGNNGANSYSPNPADVTVGQLVAWQNNGGMTHTATQNGGAGFDTGNIANGARSDTVRFTTVGNFGYQCSIHPTMVGTLNVTP